MCTSLVHVADMKLNRVFSEGRIKADNLPSVILYSLNNNIITLAVRTCIAFSFMNEPNGEEVPIAVQCQTQPPTQNNGVRRHVVKHAANCFSKLALTSLGLDLPLPTRSGLILFTIALSKKALLCFDSTFPFLLGIPCYLVLLCFDLHSLSRFSPEGSWEITKPRCPGADLVCLFRILERQQWVSPHIQ